MKKLKKLFCLITVLSALFLYNPTANAVGLVNSAVSSNSSQYISTSHFERRQHSYIAMTYQTTYVTSYTHGGGLAQGGLNNDYTSGGSNAYSNSSGSDYGNQSQEGGSGGNFDDRGAPTVVTTPVTVAVPVVVIYYQWDYIYSGFYPNISHGPAVITKSPYYVFTKWHKKLDGSSANMDIQISIPGVYIDGYTANISNWSSYHSLERYNGAGWYSVTPVSTVNGGRDGDYSYHVKYEYPYAGTTNSTLYFTFKASVVEPHTYVLNQETGTSQTINSYVNIPITVAVKIPVNGFNSTDLREPSAPTSDLGFVGSQNYYSVSY